MLGNRKSKYTYRNNFQVEARLTTKRLGVSVGSSARLVAPALALVGWLAMCFPSTAITANYNNDYRVCAGKLLRARIPAQSASQACATALRPRDLASCVSNIQGQTQIPAVDALSECRQARRPNNLAECVVGISRYSKEAVDPTVLNYCGRSLLPVSFGECVVGVRAETDFALRQAMETCINAGDRISNVLPSFTPTNPSRPTQFQPTFETVPIPSNPPRPR